MSFFSSYFFECNKERETAEENHCMQMARMHIVARNIDKPSASAYSLYKREGQPAAGIKQAEQHQKQSKAIIIYTTVLSR